tara:strand:+ start:93 stop:557 length:465 start_codon:yes stop_codon:yes gene_type:complete
MNYLTKAGVKFISETKAKKPNTTTNRQVITRDSVEALGDKLPMGSGERSTAKNPAGEARIRAHQARVDNIKRVKDKTGQDVNEGFRDWLKGKQKPGQWTDARSKRASDRAVKQAHKKAARDKTNAMMAQTDTKDPKVIQTDAERAEFDKSMDSK